VWDEFIGQWLALLPLLIPGLLPAGNLAQGLAILAGFALFRLFDVWKPWPISWLDRYVKGGLGVMIDDVLAGVFAAFVLLVGLLLLR
jgi:Phosphatidylglycerophosphatase A and related proteins